MDIYVVNPGDNVDLIAFYYNVSAAQIIFDNQLVYPYELAVGQALFIGGGERRPSRSIVANGYAYPFISECVLRQTLPYLSGLFVFSYGFTAEGNLIPPLLADEPLIAAAYEDNRLREIKMYDVDENTSCQVFESIAFDDKDINKIKIMLYDGTKGIKPLCVPLEN